MTKRRRIARLCPEGEVIMSIRLYELAGSNPDQLFSPFCWRTRFSLKHKELPFESVPWRFTENDALGFSGQTKVPVLVDGATVVHDSWTIATYLDLTYKAKPLLGDPAHVRFINAWADTVLHPAIARMVVRDILDVIPEHARPYFRQSRERAFGMTLEQVMEGREERREPFRAVLNPVRTVLRAQPWLGGEAPDYADYIVAGSLMWPRCVSAFDIMPEDDIVTDWFTKIRALFDGMGEKAVRP
jgi:glutathione S-transferase